MRFKSLSWIFIPFLFAALRAVGVAQIATTQIVDTIYHADGTTATGTALIAWPAFTTVSGDQIPAGTTSTVIASGGALSLQLVPNSGAIPIGTYYTVTYHLDDNSVTRQYWVVPSSATPVKVAAIESAVLPTSVAMQTATRSYVDTAIAAATTGHPLDSSPLVLKAGDTMTGPLVLPADPVSSLQAADKHYVDTAVASHTSSSSISGQTPNSLPLATSATALAASSHFFEVNGSSGVTNPFQMTSASPNCNLEGPSFTQYTCNQVIVADAGTTSGTTPRNLAAFTITDNAWGPAGFGGAEGRTTTVFGDSHNAAIATAGIKVVYTSNTSAFGIGDFQAQNNIHECNTGIAYMSDQGCQNYWWLGEIGQYNGTVTGGTNTQPSLHFTGGCAAALDQACVPSPGAIMIDVTAVRATGKGISHQANSLEPWLAQVATNQTTIPHTGVWGYAMNVNLAPGTTWDAPLPQTFTLQGGAGTFAAGDHACMIGSNFEEQNIVSSVSGTSPTQTITIPLSQPETSVAIFQGDCMYLSLDTDAMHGAVTTFPAVSLDGSTVIYSIPAFSTMFGGSGASPQPGGWWSTFDGGASSGFHLYAGARIVKVGTTSPTYAPFADQYLLTYLEPNSAFASGDSIESPDFPSQKVDGLELSAIQTMPGQLTGLRLHISGNSASSDAALMRFFNDAPTTNYAQFGGALGEPAFMTQSGPFSNTLNGYFTPQTSIFHFDNHQPGQTSYRILDDPSWGSLTLDQTQTWNFAGVGGLVTAGGITANGGSISTPYGYLSGAGDGGGNFAGIRFEIPSHTTNQFTWLAPCQNNFDSPDTDLCVTSQGQSRSSFAAAPDRNLNANVLSAAAHLSAPSILSSSHFFCVNQNSDACPNGSTTSASNIPGFDFYTAGQVLGGSFGNGGNLTFQANTPGDVPGGYVSVFGSGRGDGTKDSVSIGNSAGQGIEIDGTASGHNANYVGIFYPNGSVIPHPFSVNGDGYFSGAVITTSVSAAVYQGPVTAPTGACSTTGWAFSQDGHISYCNGTTWAQKM